jgi:uncharacterized protein YebE (UPF0316 family)
LPVRIVRFAKRGTLVDVGHSTRLTDYALTIVAVRGKRGSDVVGQILTLRAFRRQLNDHFFADRDAPIAYPPRA